MILSWLHMVIILILINGCLWIIFGIQVFSGVSSIEVSLDQVLTVGFTSALMYFAYLQSRIMEMQSRYYIDMNRPRLFVTWRHGESFEVYNDGNVPAWNVIINIFKEDFSINSRQDIHYIEIGALYPKSRHLFYIDIEIIKKIVENPDVGLYAKMNYYDKEKNGFKFTEEKSIISFDYESPEPV